MYARVIICEARVENLSYKVLQFLAAPQHTARRHARTVVRACMHACMAVFCMYVYVRKTCPTLVSWTLVLQVASLFGIKTCSSSKPLVLCVCVCVYPCAQEAGKRGCRVFVRVVCCLCVYAPPPGVRDAAGGPIFHHHTVEVKFVLWFCSF